MSELSEQAEALGIKVDGRWSDARIQEEINRATTPQAATTPVKLLYAHWFAADERTEAGTIVNLDIATAKKIIASGKGERADPLPGETA